MNGFHSVGMWVDKKVVLMVAKMAASLVGVSVVWTFVMLVEVLVWKRVEDLAALRVDWRATHSADARVVKLVELKVAAFGCDDGC